MTKKIKIKTITFITLLIIAGVGAFFACKKENIIDSVTNGEI
jgi:hypothetical protein